MLSPLHSVCIVSNDLAGPGGAERVACWLANCWARHGNPITLISLGPTRDCFFPLEKSVILCPIGHPPKGRNLFRSIALQLQVVRRLRTVLKRARPDCIISFIDVVNITTLLAARGLGSSVIVSERTDPHGGRLAARWNFLRWLSYPFANCLVVQSERALSFFSGRTRARARIIPNAVLPPNRGAVNGANAPRKSGHTLMALGSLRYVKGFDRLLDAFSLVAGRYSEWNLIIYGEGPCRRQLEERINELGLGPRVSLPGVTRHVYDRLREADLFVLSSRNEGFPNGLAEAMACGLPVVSFDCPSGPRELIRHGIDGVLVQDNDVGTLAQQLARLMGDPEERERLAHRAPEVLERFSPERILSLWERTVEATLARRRSDCHLGYHSDLEACP